MNTLHQGFTTSWTIDSRSMNPTHCFDTRYVLLKISWITLSFNPLAIPKFKFGCFIAFPKLINQNMHQFSSCCYIKSLKSTTSTFIKYSASAILCRSMSIRLVDSYPKYRKLIVLMQIVESENGASFGGVFFAAFQPPVLAHVDCCPRRLVNPALKPI